MVTEDRGRRPFRAIHTVNLEVLPTIHHLTEPVLIELLTSLRDQRSLEVLEIYFIREKEIDLIVQFPRLSRLRLSVVPISDRSLEKIMEMPTLRRLELVGCKYRYDKLVMLKSKRADVVVVDNSAHVMWIE